MYSKEGFVCTLQWDMFDCHMMSLLAIPIPKEIDNVSVFMGTNACSINFEAFDK